MGIPKLESPSFMIPLHLHHSFHAQGIRCPPDRVGSTWQALLTQTIIILFFIVVIVLSIIFIFNTIINIIISTADTGTQGTAVQWGAWGGMGMVAANAAVLQRMERGGIQTVNPDMGLTVLSQTLTCSTGPQVHAPSFVHLPLEVPLQAFGQPSGC